MQSGGEVAKTTQTDNFSEVRGGTGEGLKSMKEAMTKGIHEATGHERTSGARGTAVPTRRGKTTPKRQDGQEAGKRPGTNTSSRWRQRTHAR